MRKRVLATVGIVLLMLIGSAGLATSDLGEGASLFYLPIIVK